MTTQANTLKTPPSQRLAPRIVVLSDRGVFRDCVVDYLSHSGFSRTSGCPKWTVAAGATGTDGPDLLLLDVGQEHEDPAEELRRVREQWPTTKAVAIGTSIQLAALAANADGWIEISEPGARLSTIAKTAAMGRGAQFEIHPSHDLQRQIAVWHGLTRRQRQVLALIGCGMENAEIGGALGITDRAVKLHVSALFDKFHADSRVQLAIIAARAGLRASGIATGKRATI